jgi:hypothetical protein
MIESFIYEAVPTRVVFGSGTIARIREEVERLGARRALVLSTPGRGEDLANKFHRSSETFPPAFTPGRSCTRRSTRPRGRSVW